SVLALGPTPTYPIFPSLTIFPTWKYSSSITQADCAAHAHTRPKSVSPWTDDMLVCLRWLLHFLVVSPRCNLPLRTIWCLSSIEEVSWVLEPLVPVESFSG